MKKIFLLTFIFIHIQLYSQFYSAGNSPASLKWKQIKTPTVRLVFEESLQEQALQLAAYMDSVAPYVSFSLSYFPKRVDVLLHNQTPTANGFVTWTPRRSEFFTIPPQDNISADWLKHLTIHEYRHVVQISKLNKGFTKFAGYITGQQAVGITLGLYLPLWFLEGDAVTTETTLSKSGRGRSFQFNNELKAQLLEKKVYSYDKAYLGSYRDKVPNYYQMGYIFTALAREKYGAKLWDKAVTNTGKNSPFINPFNRSIRKQTGVKKKKLYTQLFNELKNDWQEENSKLVFSSYRPIIQSRKGYYQYKYLVAINDTTLVAELSGPGTRTQLVSINVNTSKTTRLVYTGYRANEPFSANSEMIVWTEQQNHPRWEHKAQSVIKTYNWDTQKVRTLTKRKQYFSPSLHPNKEWIVAVEATPDYKNYLTILDSKSGKEVRQIPTPHNYFPITPSWNHNGEAVVCLLLTDEGKALYNYYTATNQWKEITSPSFDEKKFPIQKEDKIWYVAKGEISDELFVLNTSSNKTEQLTTSEFGANYPTVLPNKKIVYSRTSSKGALPVLFTNSAPTQQNKVVARVDQLAERLAQQEKELTHLLPVNENRTNFSAKRYSKWNLFNVHSWGPVMIGFEDTNIYSGYSIMSQNLLSTMIITAGYNSDPAKKREKYSINLSYRGWFPIIDVSLLMGDDKLAVKGLVPSAMGYYSIDSKQRVDFFTLRTGLRVPLNLSRNNYHRTLQFLTKYTLENRSEITLPIEPLQDGSLLPSSETLETNIKLEKLNFQGFEYGFYFHNLQRGTSYDVGTRWGQSLQAIYRHTPLGNYNSGAIGGIITRLYLPGIGKHHSIAIHNEYQHIKNGDLYLEDFNGNTYLRNKQLISYPRGYSSIYSDDLYIFRANYHLPLWNPDVAIGGLAYLKRVRLQLFYDQAIGSFTLIRTNNLLNRHTKFSNFSTGVELHADTHFFRFIMPFSLGFRVGIRSSDNKPFAEAVIKNSLTSFLVNKKY